MSPSAFSLNRPIFITCMLFLILVLGWLALLKMPVDFFPNINLPIIMISTSYPGAGPIEIETQVSKVLEDEFSTIAGIKNLRSINKENLSVIITEFTLETDIKYAEQQIRDRIGLAKRKMPSNINGPFIKIRDTTDQPILIISLDTKLTEGDLYNFVEEVIKPRIEQIPQVSFVESSGSRKREIQVLLDRDKLKDYGIPAMQIASRLSAYGKNIPAGKINTLKNETIFRTLGELKSLNDIEDIIVTFPDNDVPVKIGDIGKVIDTYEDENHQSYLNGKKTSLLSIFRNSGANTIAIVEAIKSRIVEINREISAFPGNPYLSIVRDDSRMIYANVEDMKESVILGITLTIFVVFIFLGSGRSTFITGLAIPTSLAGSLLLMWVFGFSINIMTLLALSLSVGLLIDDAIVVRENIYRHIEMGQNPKEAALLGSKEVMIAVVATTFVILAVFIPVGFLKGAVGLFFKEFGFTVCFAMIISLCESLTVAPMLSALYVEKKKRNAARFGWPSKKIGSMLMAFDCFQGHLESKYEKILLITLRNPLLILMGALLIFIGSLFLTNYIPKTFLPPLDTGEFEITLEMFPGVNLTLMKEITLKVDKEIRSNQEIASSILFLGSQNGESNIAKFYIRLIPFKKRNMDTDEVKEKIRAQLKKYSYANPVVRDIDMMGSGQRPFSFSIIGPNLDQLESISNKIFNRLKNHPGLKDLEISSKPSKPEFQIEIDYFKAKNYGISPLAAGEELRTQVEGSIPATYRELEREFNIRVRLKEEQRNLKKAFYNTYVPNINQTLIGLPSIAKGIAATGPPFIYRQDRGRYIQISGDITPNGVGMGGVIADITFILENEIKLPPGFHYVFGGQSEHYLELEESFKLAIGLGILFVYLVLASLYESFTIPIIIMLVMPLAVSGAFVSLLVTQNSLDIFSLIGCITLMGICTKNSILLVDYTNQLVNGGMELRTAIIKAGKTRLRPILMTSLTLIAGMLPIAFGINEASKQRTSMGIAVAGGILSSTILALVVVPSALFYIERFRERGRTVVKKLIGIYS